MPYFLIWDLQDTKKKAKDSATTFDEDNIKMDLRELGCAYKKRMEVAQNHTHWWVLTSAVLNLQSTIRFT